MLYVCVFLCVQDNSKLVDEFQWISKGVGCVIHV